MYLYATVLLGKGVWVYNSSCRLQVRCNCQDVLLEISLYGLGVLTCACMCSLHFIGLVFEGSGLYEVLERRPCSIPCHVRSTSLLQYPPLVEWYRDKAFTPTNESISEYVSVLSSYWQSRHYYPRANCVQQPGNVPRYNCDLNFQYCHMGYMGRYRCDVTNKETGKTISRFLHLRSMWFISCSN